VDALQKVNQQTGRLSAVYPLALAASPGLENGCSLF
jgi:hypothetical protein